MQGTGLGGKPVQLIADTSVVNGDIGNASLNLGLGGVISGPTASTTGRCVCVQLAGTNYLHLAEVQVQGR